MSFGQSLDRVAKDGRVSVWARSSEGIHLKATWYTWYPDIVQCFALFESYVKYIWRFWRFLKHIIYCTWFFHVYSPGSREQISGSHRWPSLSGVAAFEFWVRVHFVLVWLATQLWKPFWSFFDFACNPPISVRDWWWFAAEQCSNSEHTCSLADFSDFDPPIEVRICPLHSSSQLPGGDWGAVVKFCLDLSTYTQCPMC